MEQEKAIDIIDEAIEYWHTHDTGTTLWEHLGMTEDEYGRFLRTGDFVYLENAYDGDARACGGLGGFMRATDVEQFCIEYPHFPSEVYVALSKSPIIVPSSLVKRGRWVHQKVNGFSVPQCRCSECNSEAEHETPYCPSCGALMQED